MFLFNKHSDLVILVISLWSLSFMLGLVFG